jgi:ABC-2 type transport system permease protein
MNTQSNAMPDSSIDSQAISAVAMSQTRPFYWSVRRELWENRSIYIAPLAVAVAFLFGFLISVVHLPDKMRATLALNPMQQREIIERPYNMAALLLMGTYLFVAAFYCLDALQGERRDRSILFWKSLPVSDLTTVLSKASIPFLILPLLTFAVTVATQWIMLLLSTVALAGDRQSVAMLWSQLPLFQMSLMLLYHLLAVHSLWYAPFYGWLMLASAWAKRAAFLWAALPLLAIGIVEKIAFNTSHFGVLLAYRFSGGPAGGTFTGRDIAMDPIMQLTPGRFLISPSLWLGLAVTAAFLVAAVRLRRYRGPI